MTLTTNRPTSVGGAPAVSPTPLRRRTFDRVWFDHPLMTREQARALMERVRAGDLDARVAMVCGNLRLVASLARRFRGAKPFEDLLFHGIVGLLRAVDRYEPDRGAVFSTYATHWIRKAINCALIEACAALIYLPHHQVNRVRQARRAIAELTPLLGHPPTAEELADHLELSIDSVEVTLAAMKTRDASVASIGPVQIGEARAAYDVADPRPGPAETVASADETEYRRERVARAIGTFSDRDQAILRLRYGFEDGRAHTPKEVATRLGLSAERVRQLERATWDRLAGALADLDPAASPG